MTFFLRKSRDLTHLVAWLVRNCHLAIPLAGAIWVFFLQADVLQGTFNRAGDNIQHLQAQHWIFHAISVGDNPFGPLGIDFGTPLLQFYQPLHNLITVAVVRISGWNLSAVHSYLVAILFSLSPFSLCFFLRRLGLGRWAASIASLLSLVSVSAFSNSFEAYYQVGLATQALASFLFPLFLGSLISTMRREAGIVGAILLLGLTILAHSMMAVYVFLCVVLLIFVMPATWWKNWKRGLLVGFLGISMASFWLVPFMQNSAEYRPVSGTADFSSGPAWWFDGVEMEELVDLATTGRLWDGARSIERERPPLDNLSDRNDLCRTKRVRPPVLTIMILAGALACLLRIRRTSRRFLLGGFLLSLGLYAGSDDFPLLRIVPFIEQIQVFRTIYLLELFSFGLIAVAAEDLLRLFTRVISNVTRRPLVAATLAVTLVTIPVCAWAFNEIESLAETNVDPHQFPARDGDTPTFVSEATHPFRVDARYPAGISFEVGGFKESRFQNYCTHWTSVGPKSNLALCSALRLKKDREDLFHYSGIRFFTGGNAGARAGTNRNLKSIIDRFEKGKTKPNIQTHGSEYYLDTEIDSFATPFTDSVVEVLADSAQWNSLIRAWLNDISSPAPLSTSSLPVLVTTNGGTGLPSSGHLDLSDLSANRADLYEIVLKRWKSESSTASQKVGSCDISLKRGPNPLSYQHIVMRISCKEATPVIVPMFAIRGWSARIDGNPVPIFTGGSNFLTLIAPAGEHELEFNWSMTVLGQTLLIFSLLIMATVLLVPLIRAFSKVIGFPDRKKVNLLQ